MAHTYVIQSVTVGSQALTSDPQVTVSGTVDGVSVAATCWLSTYQQNAASALSARNFLIGLMLATWTAAQVPTLPNAPSSGTTVTQ